MGITSKTFCSSQSPAIYSIARKQKGTNVVLTKESKSEALDAAILGDKQCLFGMVGAASTMKIPETLVYQVNQLIGCQPACKLQWDVKSFPSVVYEGPDDGYLLIHALHLEEVNTFMPSEVLKLVLSKSKGIAEKNLNYCIETPVDFVNLQGRITFLDALTNKVHLNYVTSVAYRICKIELPEDYQLDVDINGHGSMKVCVAGFKMEYKIDALQNVVGACLGLWAASEKLKVGNANPEAPMERPSENVHSEAWVTHENSIHRVAVARGCALQCAILNPIFKVRELQQHRQPVIS
ncbi:hypothetical protein L1049_017167 [Liquidambar formosana]|uniref:Uncharacterized protein n=1 Tax=Liquidambar formosana TaxID=63359 RepID=A0AAP0S2H4_LIQFO